MKRLFIFFMSLMFVMCLAGCDNVNKDDFESFINVNKTNVKVGETIKITASIKNNSNKSIKIKANHTDVQKIEDIIMIGVFTEFDNHDFIVNSNGGTLKSFKFKKNTLLEKELEYKVTSLNNLEIEAQFCFYIKNELIIIKSDIINIIVEK